LVGFLYVSESCQRYSNLGGVNWMDQRVDCRLTRLWLSFLGSSEASRTR
jgi:hypothetical protein